MTPVVKRWLRKAGVPIACWLLGVGMTDLGYHMKQAVLDSSQDGRLTAVETRQREHLEETKPLVDEVHGLGRRFDGLLIWLRIVANREGWPPPPEPASFELRPASRPGPWWTDEARADTLCGQEVCP